MLLCDNQREYFFGQGLEYDCADYFGAHRDGDSFIFRVWAPNADSVRLVGDFNYWQDGVSMQKSDCGVWSCRLQSASFRIGSRYKYLVTRNGRSVFKADPYAFYSECREHTASRFYDIDLFEWTDSDFIDLQKDNRIYFKDDRAVPKPMNIYELHAGSWRRHRDGSEYSWSELADELAVYLPEMGYTHLELMPITEYPFDGSWGYQVTGYFAPTSRYGEPKEFAKFIDKMHSVGIAVFLDWVPAHFTKDEHGLYEFDGGPLYEYQGKDRQENRGWGTRCFDLGRSEVRSFLISSALFWLQKYHIDGLRVDAVASMLYLDYSRQEGEWTPNERGGRENLEAIAFLQEMNVQTHGRFPGVLTIAEESTAWPGVCKPVCDGGLGFSMKWNMGWMNDTLRYCKEDPIYRKYHHDQMTFSLMYAFSENFVLPISHDEVVHGKGTVIGNAPGDLWQKFALARLLYSYMWAHPGKKLLFMGADIGQWKEWNFDTGLDWDLLQYDDTHGGLQRCVTDLNRLYREEKALHDLDFDERGFEWISCGRWEESVFAFMRKAEDWRDHIIVAANFTPVPRRTFIGVPERVDYQEIFCSDSPYYGGSGVGNGRRQAIDSPCDGRPWAIEILIPPLGASYFKPVRVPENGGPTEAKETKDGEK